MTAIPVLQVHLGIIELLLHVIELVVQSFVTMFLVPELLIAPDGGVRNTAQMLSDLGQRVLLCSLKAVA